MGDNLCGRVMMRIAGFVGFEGFGCGFVSHKFSAHVLIVDISIMLIEGGSRAWFPA